MMAAAATWPAQLPGPLLGSIREAPADTRVVTPTDSKFVKMHQSSATGVRPADLQWLVPEADFNTYFLPFYEDDLANGTLSFNMTYWRTGASAEWIFLKPDPRWEYEYPFYRITAAIGRLP